MSEHKDKAKPTEELSEFKPPRVSLVDEGAVGDEFFVLKNRGEVAETEPVTTTETKTPIPFYVRRNAIAHLDLVQKRIIFLQKTIADFAGEQIDDNVTDVSQPIADEIFKIHDELQAMTNGEVKVAKSVVAESANWIAIEKSVLSNSLRDNLTKILSGVTEKIAETSKILDDDTSSLEQFIYGLDRSVWNLRSVCDVAYTFYRLGKEFIDDKESSVAKSTIAETEETSDNVDNIEKSGKKVSDARMKQLKKLHEQVKALRKAAAAIETEMTGILSEVAAEPVGVVVKGLEDQMGDEIQKTEVATETVAAEAPKTEPTSSDIVKDVSEQVVAKMRDAFKESLVDFNAGIASVIEKTTALEKRMEKLENAPVQSHAVEPVAKTREHTTDETKEVFKGLFHFGPGPRNQAPRE